MLPSHQERFARASIVMSLHSWQRIAMVDLWREFPITDASARAPPMQEVEGSSLSSYHLPSASRQTGGFFVACELLGE